LRPGAPLVAPELVLADKLAEYAEILERRLAGSSNRTKAAGKLVTIALQKRLLSSIEAFARTLAVHIRHAPKAAPATRPAEAPSQTTFLDDSGETDDDLTEEQAVELDEVAVARATKAGASADDARAKVLLADMTSIADGARDLPDAKIRAIVDWIRKNQCPDLPKPGAKRSGAAKWLPPRPLPAAKGEEPQLFKGAVLIFTEYAHTKDYLVHQLEAALAGTELARGSSRCTAGCRRRTGSRSSRSSTTPGTRCGSSSARGARARRADRRPSGGRRDPSRERSTGRECLRSASPLPTAQSPAPGAAGPSPAPCASTAPAASAAVPNAASAAVPNAASAAASHCASVPRLRGSPPRSRADSLATPASPARRGGGTVLHLRPSATTGHILPPRRGASAHARGSARGALRTGRARQLTPGFPSYRASVDLAAPWRSGGHHPPLGLTTPLALASTAP
jgi:hypothetical protein